jgi:hypothetical protein
MTQRKVAKATGVPELWLGRLVMDEEAAGDHAKEASESGDDRKGALAQPLYSRPRRELIPYHRSKTNRGQGGEVSGQRCEREVCRGLYHEFSTLPANPERRDSSLVHLDEALGADELLEVTPHLALRAGLTVELATGRTLP